MTIVEHFGEKAHGSDRQGHASKSNELLLKRNL
jgi:hypothetical protein